MNEKLLDLLLITSNAVVALLTLMAAQTDIDAALEIQTGYKKDMLKLIKE